MCIRDRVLALQEYDITWEYIPGRKNVAADVLSRINIQDQTFDGEKEQLAKVYHIIKSRVDLENILKQCKYMTQYSLNYNLIDYF